MTLKIFIHYNSDGEIVAMTHEDVMFYEQRLAAGEPIIEIPEQFDFKNYCVDVETKQILAKPLDQEGS